MIEEISEEEMKQGGELWKRFTGFWKMGKELADSMDDKEKSKRGFMGNTAFLDVMLEYGYNYYYAKREKKPVSQGI